MGLASSSSNSRIAEVWKIFNQDHLAAVAMIVEFVSYNGSMDMFTHARVKLDLLPTGRPGFEHAFEALNRCALGCSSGRLTWWSSP